MDILLWVLQGLLAVAMLMPGLMKLTSSKADLKKKGKGKMDWTDDLGAGAIKMIGALEVLIAAGLILPHLLGIVPILTPIAAAGSAFVMIGALMLHLRRKDGVQALSTNLVILLIAAFVAYGRFVLLPA